MIMRGTPIPGTDIPSNTESITHTNQNNESESATGTHDGAITVALPNNLTMEQAVDEKSDISFTYPTTLPYQYVTLAEWPPRFINSSTFTSCQLDAQTQAMSGATSSTMTVNGRSYCIWETAAGAAGSVYKSYQITYPKDDQFLTMIFAVRFPQCQNYPDEQIAICEAEQGNFPLAALIDTVGQSAQLPN